MRLSLNTKIYDEILSIVRELVSEYDLPVMVTDVEPASPSYPLIIIKEITNNITGKTTENSQMTTILGYEFDIYALNNGTVKSRRKICYELAEIVEKFMYINNFTRISLATTPTVDKTLYRVTSRYTTHLFNNKNRLY